MKKIITFIAIIMVALTTTPVMADDSISDEEQYHLSIYDTNIRENINDDETVKCDCFDLCSCTQKYHLLENAKQDDFYLAFFNSELVYPLEGVYQDASSSMEKFFGYETNKILKNISPVLNEKQKNIEYVFKNKKTDLYGLLSSFCTNDDVFSPSQTNVIITDLWDTKGIKENFFYYGQIVFCVPYESSNKEAVLHCEDVVNDLIFNHNHSRFGVGGISSFSIYLVYTDKTIVEYSNGSFNGSDGYMKVLVP